MPSNFSREMWRELFSYTIHLIGYFFANQNWQMFPGKCLVSGHISLNTHLLLPSYFSLEGIVSNRRERRREEMREREKRKEEKGKGERGNEGKSKEEGGEAKQREE